MSFILHAVPQGVVYGYRANDNVTFIQALRTAEGAPRMRSEYLFETGDRPQVQAYFAIGHIDALLEIEHKLKDKTCLTADHIRDFIGKTNVTVVVIADGWIITVTKNSVSSQPLNPGGTTLSFGEIAHNPVNKGRFNLQDMGYLQQTISFLPPPPQK